MESDLGNLITEQVNQRTRNLDTLSTLEMMQLMNEEDQRVAFAVKKVLPQIAMAVDQIRSTLSNNGRLFYIGAGTSGRLGILDAAECPPTFGTRPEQVQGIIAGGEQALRHAIEGVEDSSLQGEADLKERQFSSVDLLIGIAASGRTPYVRGALAYAQRKDAISVAITCNPGSPLGKQADIAIEVDVGPEILLGSTRLKAGTAQKMILNMLSTGAMVGLGKVYQNLMVDLQPTNQKLRQRALRLIQLATGVKQEEASHAFTLSGEETKTAIVMLLGAFSPEEARARLAEKNGRIREVVEQQ